MDREEARVLAEETVKALFKEQQEREKEKKTLFARVTVFGGNIFLTAATAFVVFLVSNMIRNYATDATEGRRQAEKALETVQEALATAEAAVNTAGSQKVRVDVLGDELAVLKAEVASAHGIVPLRATPVTVEEFTEAREGIKAVEDKALYRQQMLRD